MPVDLGGKEKTMCVSPTILKPAGYFYAGSEPVLIPCRMCWQCKLNAVENWTGRNLAEATTSVASYAVTFTYGRDYDGRSDHIQAVQLMYSDIQKMLKRMRKAGYVVRYIIAGEYGASLQRAHWHGVFHFYGENLPEWDGQHLDWSQEQWDRVGGIHIPEWSIYGDPLGFVHIKEATYAHTRYALKYLLKDQYDPYKQNMVNMSRKPPLGFEYFTKLAVETAQNRLPILDLKYSFDVKTRSGEERNIKFLLRRRMAEIYLETYIQAWKDLYGNNRWPTSEIVDNFAQWGRVVNENMATENWVKEIPSDESIFAFDGRVKKEVQAERERGTYFGWLKWKAGNDIEARRIERIKARQNGEEAQRRRRQQQASERQEAVRAACAKAGITTDEYETYSPSWKAYTRAFPEHSKSLRDANKADGGRRSCRYW